MSALVSAVVSVCTVYGVLRWGGLHGGLAALTSGEHGAAPEARVPDVVGMRAEAADELLSARKLRLVVRERRSDPQVQEGAVIEQSPLAQSRVTSGAEVAVVLSTGSALPKVPNIVGQPFEEAQKAIEAAGLKLGPISDAEGGEPGTVTAVVPEAGKQVEPGTTVALSVARPKVAVPRLLGEHIRKAREAIAKAGLVVGSVNEVYNAHRRGNLILQQDPEAGTKVAPGSKVSLVVNQGD